ncbi:MAG: glycosyltransferase family 39 protein, partial [Actinomycetota bacterium]|nr:glycosyltransferase family 39 protein [Actinomycetota bacterium]
FPPGLEQDEASTGYDAFALLHYGIDRHGFHSPVMFVSWGSGQYALPGYLAMPFFVLFGFSVASLRAVNLIAGILSLPAFYALVRTTGDKLLAVLAVFLLAISPWHIMISRWELESNLLPALFLFAVFFLRRARESPRSFVLAAVFFALTLYAYGTAYLATPVFLALAALAFRWRRPVSWRPVVQAVAIFAVLALPIALYVVINEFKLSSIKTPVLSIPRLSGVPRFQTISSLFGNGPGVIDNLHTFWRLLVTGDDKLVLNSVPGFGYLYEFGLALAILGLVVTLSRRRFWLRETEFFFLAWLAASIVLAATESPNINRINIVFLPLIFFAAAGIRAIAASRVLLAAIVAYHCIALVHFTHAYFGASYRSQASFVSFEHFGEAINLAASATSGPLCITSRVNEPYIYVLFYRRIDPHLFLQTVHYENPGAEFEQVSSFDRYTFGLDRCDPARTQAYVADQDEAGQIDQARFSTQQIGRYVVGLRR